MAKFFGWSFSVNKGSCRQTSVGYSVTETGTRYIFGIPVGSSEVTVSGLKECPPDTVVNPPIEKSELLSIERGIQELSELIK